jgi:hypothetical protein
MLMAGIKASASAHTPQLSHAELRERLAQNDWETGMAQLKRAERKVQDMARSDRSDTQERERSASETSRIVTEYVATYLPTGVAVLKGGNKGAERAHGNASQRAARDLQRIDWYAKQKVATGASDDEILARPDCPEQLSGRTLSRLKVKHADLLQTLLNSK